MLNDKIKKKKLNQIKLILLTEIGLSGGIRKSFPEGDGKEYNVSVLCLESCQPCGRGR